MNEENTNNNSSNENAMAGDTPPEQDLTVKTPGETEQFVESEEAPVADSLSRTEPDQPQAVNPAPEEQAPQTVAPTNSRKKILIVVAVVLAVVALGVTAWWLLAGNGSDDAKDSAVVSKKVSKLGVAVTVADGTVEYGRDNVWKPLTVDGNEKLAEGDLIRTGADGRAVLTLDDGSALRLDSQTQVKLNSLVASDVKIDQIEGAVYSRVVASDRKYTVHIDDASFQALGTAFATFKRTDRTGLQVFQSSVKASGLEQAVAEGKQYYVANANADLQKKVTDIDLATLVNDAFVAWNVAEDKKEANFKEKLGVLARYDEVVASENAKRLAEAEAKKVADAVAEKARLEAERKAREALANAGAMSAKLSDGGIAWAYTGTAPDGFKVVYSSTNSTPSFKQSGTTATYVSEPSARFLSYPKEMQKDVTYYVRVCVYQPNNTADPCRDYSNVLQVKRM